MQTLYVDLVSRISGYVTPLRQAAAATRATAGEIAADLRKLDDAAVAGFRSVQGSLAELDEKVLTSTRAQANAWRTAGREIKTEIGSIVDAQQVATRATIRAAADQARALRNEAAALPRNDPARQALYLQARDYEDQSRALNRMRSDAMATRRAIGEVALVTGGVFVAAMAGGVVAAAHLQTQMANVATISDALNGKVTMNGRVVRDQAAQVAMAAHNWNAMTNAVLDMSRELPQSATELTRSLYDIVSSGFDGADALAILHAAAVGASAGLTTTADAAKGIVAVLNAWGLSAQQATDVNDIMFQTVNKGVITYQELSHTLGMYAAMAATASGATDHSTKSFAEAEAALAAMTLAGVPAEQAATSLNRVYTQLLHPSAALSDAYHKMGFESGQQAVQTLGLHGVLTKLTTEYGNNASAALKLFPEIRAARGYMAATANEGQNYARVFRSIVDPTERAAAAQKALEKQQGTAAYQMNLLKNSGIALGIEFGRTMLPAVELAEKLLSGFLSTIEHIPAPLRDVIGVLVLVGGAVLIFGGAWLIASQKIEAFQIRMEAATVEGSRLPGVMSMAGKGLGALSAALAIATIAFTIFEGHQQHVKQLSDTLASAIQNEAGALKGSAVDAAITQQLISEGVIGQLRKAGVTVPEAVAAIEAGGDRYKAFLHQVVDSESWYDRNTKRNSSSMWQDSPFGTAAAGKISDIQSAWEKATKAQRDATSAAMQTASATSTQTNSLAGLSALTAQTGTGVDQLTDSQKALNTQLSAMVNEVDAAKTALSSLQSPVDVFNTINSADAKAAASAAKDAAASYTGSLHGRTLAAQQHARDLSRAAADATGSEKHQYTLRARAAADYARDVARSNRAAAKSAQDFAREGVVSLKQWLAGLDTASATQHQWDADLHEIAAKGGSQQLIDSLSSLGLKGVAITRQIADLTGPQIARINTQFASLAPNAQASIDKWADTLARELTMRANYLSNLAKLTLAGHGDIVTAIEGITDPAQAAAMADAAVHATGRSLDRLGGLLAEKARIAGQDFQNGLDILTTIAASKGKETVEQLAAQFTGGDLGQMYLVLQQLKDQIKDLAVKHYIDLILTATGPKDAVQVVVVPKLASGLANFIPGVGTYTPGVTDGGSFSGLLLAPTMPSNLGLTESSQPLPASTGGARRAQANGGLVTFANGGENHIAQIAAPGDYRIWAEPETGGEAYIPLDPSKRQRSAQVLHAVAQRFGMHLTPAMAGGGLLDVSVTQRGGLADLMRFVAYGGASGATGRPGAAAGTGQLKAWVAQALTVLGLPDALLPGIVSMVMHESGGNPNSVNRWDSNAKAGRPSQGLMQTIPGTFYGYALPGYNTNILDPVSNIIAGVRYAISRYGIGMVMAGGRHDARGNYLGYADGGIVDPTPMSFSYSPAGAGGGMQFTPFLTPSSVLSDYNATQAAAGHTTYGPLPLSGFLAGLDASAHRLAVWRANLAIIARRAGADVANALAAMGADGERYVTQFAHASGPRLRELAKDIGQITGAASAATASLSDFNTQLSAQVATSAQMAVNLETLASRGYGQLARQIAAVGGTAGAALAAQAATANAATLRTVARTVAAGANVLTPQQLDETLQIMAAISAHHGAGIHDVAAYTGLGEDEIIADANKALRRIRAMGAPSARFRSDLSKANAYQPYEVGGYAPPGSGIRWNEAGAEGEWLIPGSSRLRPRATHLLRQVAGRFGYGLTPQAAAVGPVGVTGGQTTVVVVQAPAGGDGPLIGSLSLSVPAGASPKEIIDEAFHQARVARLRRGGR